MDHFNAGGIRAVGMLFFKIHAVNRTIIRRRFAWNESGVKFPLRIILGGFLPA